MSEPTLSYKESIPGIYERYLGPYIFEPFAVYITGRIKGSPQRVLEIAAGTGRVTKHIAERIGKEATLIATDINPAMLDIARQQVDATNVEFQQADAQDLPFPDNSFDCVICQFGYMFLPDRQKGFNESWRVLKPGGQFLFVTWHKKENNITYNISHETILGFLKEPPPPYFGKPYSMHDPVELRSYLTIAGFTTATIEKIALEGESSTALDVATGFLEGNSIVGEILKDGPEQVEIVRNTIASKINQQVSKDPVRSQLNAWVGEAFK
jgi:SAM-dependent methyltransferase